MQNTQVQGTVQRRRLFRGESAPLHDSFYGTDSCPGCIALLRALVEQCGGAAFAREWRAKAPVQRRDFKNHRRALVRHGFAKRGGDRRFRPTEHYNNMNYWGIKFLIEALMTFHPEVAHYGGSGINMFGGHFPVTTPWVVEMRTAIRSAVQREIGRHQERAALRVTPLTERQAWEIEMNQLVSFPRVIVVDVDALLNDPTHATEAAAATVDPYLEWVRHTRPQQEAPPFVEDLNEARRRAFRTVRVRGPRPGPPNAAPDEAAPSTKSTPTAPTLDTASAVGG